MRIIEPSKSSNSSKSELGRKKHIRFPTIKLFVFISLLIGLVLTFSNKVQSPESNTSLEESSNNQTIESPKQNTVLGPMTFSGNEFRLLYDQLLQPNLDKVDTPPPITGNDVADTRIRQITENRGYKLRSSPTESLLSVDGYLLQPIVREDWIALKNEATRNGLTISITSGYRSVDNQRKLFLARLTALGVSYSDIANGRADAEIDETLVTTATPGYSKHHTGYTLDFLCAGYAFENFKNSTCNTWLEADNYENAKKHGFIPSYPPDADLQGPDPEAWEYVWVGKEVLYP